MAMDTFKCWPLDGAINDNAVPYNYTDIVAGMFVKKDSQGKLVLADGTAGERAYFALENATDLAVKGAKKMAYVIQNAIMLTDQYDTGETYGYNTPLKVDSGDPGKLTPWVAMDTEPIVAYADGTVTRDSVEYLKIIF